MMGSSSTLPLQPVTGSTDCCTALETDGTCSACSRGSSSLYADPPPLLQIKGTGCSSAALLHH